MSRAVDLTAVVTAHHEGLIAHKTMRSVFEALDEVKKAGYSYEVIVHIDNGDKATIDYFDRYKKHKNIRIVQNCFGDLGSSRNHAVSVAGGKYVAFLDGDDLISNNWYINAIKLLEESKEEIVVHPEAILTFGVDQPNILTLQKDSQDTNKDTLILLGENCWCSVAMAKKDLFRKYPYKKMCNGYSFEDYAFNADTIYDGIKHRVASKTILFYRKSGNSMLDKANSGNAVLPYSKLFDFEKIKPLNNVTKNSNKRISFKNKCYKIYKKIRNNNALNQFITPVAKLVLPLVKHNKKITIPNWIIDEWVKINQIDSQLYPYKDLINKVLYYSAEEHIAVGEAYWKIANDITHKPDYIFIVPWVIRGGAEKALLNYIKALKSTYPDWKFTVIATQPAKNSWVNNLPEYVDFIDFGNIAFGLNLIDSDQLMSKLITQLECKKLHIINSEYGYAWARRHKDLIKFRYELNVSLFAWGYISGSDLKGKFSYDNPDLFSIFNIVKNVFTDNIAVIDYTVEYNGFDRNKFKVHYQPVETINYLEPKCGLVKDGEMKLLWAGRIATEKMPELIAQIGKNLKSSVSIDVYGEFSPGVDRKIFNNVSSIKYMGPYDGFGSLPINKYDAFLYTCLNDGVPNVVLEAAAAGLPIIASNDGGVGEFVKDKKTGLLIKDYLKYEEYLKAIEFALKHPEEMAIYAKNAQKLLTKQHSVAEFERKVREDIK